MSLLDWNLIKTIIFGKRRRKSKLQPEINDEELKWNETCSQMTIERTQEPEEKAAAKFLICAH